MAKTRATVQPPARASAEIHEIREALEFRAELGRTLQGAGDAAVEPVEDRSRDDGEDRELEAALHREADRGEPEAERHQRDHVGQDEAHRHLAEAALPRRAVGVKARRRVGQVVQIRIGHGEL